MKTIMNEKIKSSLKAIELLSFDVALNIIKTFSKDIHENIYIIQALFVKLFNNYDYIDKHNFRYSGQDKYYKTWKNFIHKKRVLKCFEKNYDLLNHYVNIMAKEGYYPFVVDLYTHRLVYIYGYLKKWEDINKIYEIINKQEIVYTKVFYDYFGLNSFETEKPWAYYDLAWYIPHEKIYKLDLFDKNGELLPLNNFKIEIEKFKININIECIQPKNNGDSIT